jgi:hypothetical protein
MVQVFAPADADGRGYVRAGYLVGGGLVLTARHVIEGAIAPCEVRTLRGSRGSRRRCCGPARRTATLRCCVSRAAGDVERVRLGRLVGADRVACEATGFPWAQLRRRDDTPVRRSEHIVGEIDRFSDQGPGVPSRLLTIRVTGSVPEARRSSWAGMSGAGLVCGELLVGVVIVDPARLGSDRLLATPLSAARGLSTRWALRVTYRTCSRRSRRRACWSAPTNRRRDRGRARRAPICWAPATASCRFVRVSSLMSCAAGQSAARKLMSLC